MWDRVYLQWFRDQGRGQAAADAMGAEQSSDGTWPVATLPLPTDTPISSDEPNWLRLLTEFGVNATTCYK